MLNGIYSIMKVVLLLALLFSLWPPGTAFASHDLVAITFISGPVGVGTQFFGSEDVRGAPPPRFSQTGPVTGELVYVGQLCDGDSVENAAALDPGDIAVVRRGTCMFTDKILNAQALGAGAAVIANDRPSGTVITNWIATNPEAITIPTLFISTADGDAIAASPTGNSATIDALPVEQALQNLSDELQEIVDNNPGTPLADKVEDALAKAQTALDELSKPDNQAAAGNIEGAVGDLEAALGLDPAQDPALTGLMDGLSGIARQLAADAIADAIAQGGDPAKIIEAEQALADGDVLLGSGAFKDAVNKYKDALSKAESALPS